MKNNTFKILMLGGGKRVSLARRFKYALKKLDLEPQIFSYDLTTNEPILKEAKIIKGFKWNSQNVINDLKVKILENNFDLLISNVDPALVFQSQLAKEYKCANIISPHKTIINCQCKELFQNFCEDNSLPIIPRWDNETYPFFIKPKKGSSSKDARLIYSLTELKNEFSSCEEFFIKQNYIKGKEYTVDAYIDKNNIIKALSPRERIKTSNGEVEITRTIRDKEIEHLSKIIIDKFSLKGPISIQFIRSKNDKKLWLMEINPRLAGGVIASIEAGYNIPEMLIKDILDYDIQQTNLTKNIIMKRYFEEIFYEDDN